MHSWSSGRCRLKISTSSTERRTGRMSWCGARTFQISLRVSAVSPAPIAKHGSPPIHLAQLPGVKTTGRLRNVGSRRDPGMACVIPPPDGRATEPRLLDRSRFGQRWPRCNPDTLARSSRCADNGAHEQTPEQMSRDRGPTDRPQLEDLVHRARTELRDWTDTADSDPGVALLELFAFVGDLLMRHSEWLMS